MKFGDKIKEICKQEGINLKKFSELSLIPYETIKNYSQGRSTPSIDQVLKIVDVPQFSKYRGLIFDMPDSVEGQESEFINLFRRLQEADKEDEAMDYLRFLVDRGTKK